MKKFVLSWEDNQDTPITASNLSKASYQSYSTKDNILFIDNSTFAPNGAADNQLKIRANSRILMTVPKTSAIFKFDDSLINHNSTISPSQYENAEYRIESIEGDKSISLDKGCTNKINNSSFELPLNLGNIPNWTIEKNNPAAVDSDIVLSSTEKLYGSKSLKATVSAAADQISLQQNYQNTNSFTADYVSFSFYYKSNDSFTLKLESDTVTATHIYLSLTQSWTQGDSSITIPASTEWTRYEIKNIITTSINAQKKISVKFLFTEPSSTTYIDAVQLEDNNFCTSFAESSRSVSKIKYSSNIINLNEGFLDITLMIKSLELNSNNKIFIVKSNSGAVPLQCYIDEQNKRIVLSVLDANLQTNKTCAITFTQFEFDNLIDNWIRLIISWDKDYGISIAFRNYSNNTSKNNIFQTTFSVVEYQEIDYLEIACDNNSERLNCIIDCIKINVFKESDSSVQSYFDENTHQDEDVNRLFESTGENIVLDSSYLEGASEFIQGSYRVYIYDDLSSDEASIIIMPVSFVSSKYSLFLKLIGGFTVDNSNQIIVSSVWDIYSKNAAVIQAERFILHGVDSSSNSIEFSKTPFGDQDLAKFNIQTRFTNEVDFNNGSTDFMKVVPTSNGYVDFHSIRIGPDPGTITTLASQELLITSSGSISIQALPGVLLKIEDLRFDSSTIYSSGSYNTVIENNKSTSEITLNSYTGKTRLIGSQYQLSSSTSTLDSASITVSPTTLLDINSPSGGAAILLDNISIKNNDIYGSGVGINVTSDLNIALTKQINFSADTRHKINYYGTQYATGVQGSTLYNRTALHFGFHAGGIHSDTQLDPGAGGSLLAAITSNDLAATVSATSRFYAGKVFNAVYNDLAECWLLADKVDYNEVVYQTKNGIKRTSKRAQKATIGVVSNTYGFVLGSEGFEQDLSISKKAPIAISGRVKVKIKNNAQIGDELISYKNGFAIKANLLEKILKRDRIIGRVDSIIENELVWMKVV